MDGRHVRRTEFHLGAIIHPHLLPSCKKDLHMEPLAAIVTNDWPGMLGPLPAKLKGFPVDCKSPDREDLDLNLLK